MKSLNISVSSCNRCFGQGIHELTEIVRDFRKSLKLLAESYAVFLHANQGIFFFFFFFFRSTQGGGIQFTD